VKMNGLRPLRAEGPNYRTIHGRPADTRWRAPQVLEVKQAEPPCLDPTYVVYVANACEVCGVY